MLSALTCAYNLLVGGMLVPAGRDLLAPRHHAGRHRQHVARLRRGHRFHDQDGLDANTPIYVSLAVSLASLVVISLATCATRREPGWRAAPARTEFSSSRSKT